MALVRDRSLFSNKWLQGVRAIPEMGMRGKIAVYTRSVTYVNNVPTVLKTYVYGGALGAKARIQPLGSPSLVSDTGDTTYPHKVRFSIPLGSNTSPLVPETMFVDVIDGGLNPELEGLVLVMREVLDSSNPIERTFVAEVDTSG